MNIHASIVQKILKMTARRSMPPCRRFMPQNFCSGVDELNSASATTETTSKQLVGKHLSDSVRCTNLYGDTPKTSDAATGMIPVSVLEKGYDVVVIGGGPSGVSGAFQAALMGHSALIVDYPKAERDYRGLDVFFGGPTGLFSKALRDAAKTLDVRALRAFGLDEDVIWKQITNQCVKLATRNAENVVDTLRRYRIDYQQGKAKLKQTTNGLTVEITMPGTDQVATVPADHALLATGSKPFRLDSIPFDDVRIFDNDTINKLTFLPKSVAIAGGGIIAIEYARIFHKLGAEVSLIIREESAVYCLHRMGMDKDIASYLVNSMIDEGIKVYPNTVIDKFTKVPRHLEEPVEMTLISSTSSSTDPIPVHGGSLKADIYLAAIGRKPTFDLTGGLAETLGLDEAKINWDINGGIDVNRKTYQTSNSQVYATGDVIGSPALASTGAEQAKIAVLNMIDATKAREIMDEHDDTFPVGIWTMPEIGYYGYTKDRAIAEGYDVEEGEATYKNCLRGRVFAPEGLIKLIFEKKSGVIMGCHIIGDDACELIHFGMSLVKKNVTIFTLCNEVFTAVTYHELFKEAALDGDAKLDFGASWQVIIRAISDGIDDNNVPTPHDLRQMFDRINQSHTEYLNADDLHHMFQKLGSNVNRKYIEKLIQFADLDDSGGIDFDEFQALFNTLTSWKKSLNVNRSNLCHHLEKHEDVPK